VYTSVQFTFASISGEGIYVEFARRNLYFIELLNIFLVGELMVDPPYIIASVRDPVQHFISMYRFANVHYAVEMLTLLKLDLWESMRIFLKNPQLVRDVYNTFSGDELIDFELIHLVRPNLQTFSLGLPPHASLSEIQARAKDVDHFVISEDFFSSIVLMAKELCLPFDDLVFVKQNIQVKMKPDMSAGIPDDIVRMIKSYNSGDAILYESAKQRLATSKEQHERHINDVAIYKSVIKRYARRCQVTNARLAKVDDNYCLPEEQTYFYKLVRDKVRKKLLNELQAEYETLNS